jgi:proline-specific peptidase
LTVVEGHVDWRRGRTWYRVAGRDRDATPLLALHGGPGSTHHYFAPLEQLAPERPVVVYDQLGCGSSDKPTDIEWNVALFRDEVAAVRDQLGLNEIHLLGTSWGGMLAQEHFFSGARGIRSLVLSSTLADLELWAEEQRLLVKELPSDLVAIYERIEATGDYDDPDYARLEEAYFDRHFYRGPKPRPELERMAAEKAPDVYRAMQGPNEWTVTGALRGWRTRDRLHEIDVPTLVVRGAYDMCTERIAAELVERIPDVRELVLRHSSHTPVLEETARYLGELSAFFAEVEAA